MSSVIYLHRGWLDYYKISKYLSSRGLFVKSRTLSYKGSFYWKTNYFYTNTYALSSQIPVPDIPQAPSQTIISDLNKNFENLEHAESTFSSLGLGGWSPVGLMEYWFEYLHITAGFQWWSAIALTTFIIRTALLPLVLKMQRNATKMNEHLPEIQLLSLKMTQARQAGDALTATKYSYELMNFMKNNDINPAKSFILPIAQIPIFVSVFFALKNMCNVPVSSMKTGGLSWFTDLTVIDPFYLLPLLTSLTLWITIKVGADGANYQLRQPGLMRYAVHFLPVACFPFMINFPSAILFYWFTTNCISLLQMCLFQIPAVRKVLKLGELKKHSPDMLPIKKTGFIEGFQEAWTNMKITNDLADRKRIDEMQFRRAGLGPIQQTYRNWTQLKK